MTKSFSLIIGIVGFVMSSKITKSANYIYSYKRYSKLVHEIHNNFLTVKNSELINLASGNTAKFKEDLQKADKIIRANLDEYNVTEYLDYWATHDIDAVNSDDKKNKGRVWFNYSCFNCYL